MTENEVYDIVEKTPYDHVIFSTVPQLDDDLGVFPKNATCWRFSARSSGHYPKRTRGFLMTKKDYTDLPSSFALRVSWEDFVNHYVVQARSRVVQNFARSLREQNL